MSEPTRMFLTFPKAMAYAQVDAWRLAKWMANRTVDWAWDRDGVISISVESLEEAAGGQVRRHVLRHARAL